MSLHFRGPLRLKQLAVYMPSADRKRDQHDSEKAEETESARLKRHGNSHAHAHGHAHQYLHQRRHQLQHHTQHPERVHEDDSGDEAEKEKRACPLAWVTATIDGQVQSWINDYCPGYE